jgi:hypothetical protein
MRRHLNPELCRLVFHEDMHQETRQMREADIMDVYFHEEYSQFLTIAFHRWSNKIYNLTYEFALERNANGKMEVDYARVKSRKITPNNAYMRNMEQFQVNELVETKFYDISVFDYCEKMVLCDKRGNIIFSFMGHDSYTVSPKYAFTSNGKYFVYIDEWEDGDMRTEPDVHILQVATMSDVKWERKKHFIMVMSAFGCLEVLKKIESNPYKKVLSSSDQHKRQGIDLSIENQGVQLLFESLFCPNVLWNVLAYL